MSYHHLTLLERKALSKMKKEKKSLREISRILARSPSSISREVKRNLSHSGRHVEYRPVIAQKQYQRRKHAPRGGLWGDNQLSAYVQEKLLETWSPEQVSHRLPLDYPDCPEMRVAHSTIYRWLHQHLLSQAAALQLRHANHKHGEHRGKFLGIRLLKERGKEIWRRERCGDWELDTIVSSSHESHAGLLTMCDRKSRFCVIVLLERCQSNKHVFQALAAVVQQVPCLSFSTDQGTEFGCYRKVEEELGIPMFFCRPASPWQKGSVENLNGLIRQFFPKGTNFVDVSPASVHTAMTILNNRPRKCLAWATPAECIALHGA